VEDLSGKVAVVTGGASGIGLALAHRWAAEGMKLVLGDIEADALERAAASLPSGTEVVTVVADVSKVEQVEEIRLSALEAFGAVHVVCNNAGVGAGGAIESVAVADWEWILGVNLWGVIHGVRTFLPLLQDQGEGHIVNTASVAGLFSAPYMGPYNVSKYGVVALSETLFNELAIAQSNVGVSVLCPSWVKTRIAESGRNRPGGPGDPEEAAAITEVINDFISTGIDPADVADRVAEAVKVRRFWILTHDDTRAAVSARTTSILEDGAPPLLMH
jgi:NAD(P)-dependent dehydrogenase (short-subunit alcohol dehydrogenase family)